MIWHGFSLFRSGGVYLGRRSARSRCCGIGEWRARALWKNNAADFAPTLRGGQDPPHCFSLRRVGEERRAEKGGTNAHMWILRWRGDGPDLG